MATILYICYAFKKANRLENEAAEKLSQAQSLFANNSKQLEFLPEDYRYPLATEYMIKVVGTGRAGNINEALNMFDEQMHRWTMEQSAKSILAEQKRQSQQLRALQGTASAAAVASVFRLLK